MLLNIAFKFGKYASYMELKLEGDLNSNILNTYLKKKKKKSEIFFHVQL